MAKMTKMTKSAYYAKSAKMDQMDKTLKIVENCQNCFSIFNDEISYLGGQIKPSVRSNENILNSNPIVPIDYFEIRSVILGVRSSLTSDR